MIENGKLINPEARIEVTNACNAHCVICPREKMKRPKVRMTNRRFKACVDQVKSMGAETISPFGYGEPLLDKGIFNKIEYCTELGLDTFITTNAQLLGVDESHNLLKAGLSQIRFSVHGLNNKDYQSVHRGLDYDIVIRNISNFIAINAIKYGKACQVDVTVIPMHNEPLSIIRNRWEHYADLLEVWKPHNWSGGRDYRSFTQVRKKTCGRPFRGPVQINSDGTVMVCCFDYNAEMTVGNIFTTHLVDILTGDKMNAIRQAHRTGEHFGLPCNTCDQLNVTDENPLLYSSADPKRQTGRTAGTKFKLEE
jgi:MoaA/NifB/PqqE/SkfB family radical SAM enzyme